MRGLEHLHPYVAAKARLFVVKAAQMGEKVQITDTLRTAEEQDALYAQGRTRPGRIVTNAKAGESYHNYGLAFDYVVVRAGQAYWGADAYDALGPVGEDLGLEWGGRWRTKDRPHFQYSFGRTISELKSGRKIPIVASLRGSGRRHSRCLS